MKLMTTLAASALAFWASTAAAEPPRLRESKPVAEAIIRGRNAQYVVRFDSPVDHATSRMAIVQGERQVQQLHLLLDSATDTLFAEAEAPAPGRYVLRWEAHSATGDVSRGDIPFSVAP
jgi:methionine-rich copper-binding protein CopC